MKKGLKVLICLLAIIGIGVGGFAVHQHQEKEKMIKIATSEEAKKVIEEYLKNLDNRALTNEGLIKSYQIQREKLYYNPMGGLSVLVILNDDEQLYVRLLIIKSSETGDYEISGSVKSASLVNLLDN
ncbi:DUF1310 family protein [Streptococcus ferus]|uniref:Lmo2807 protein n=1 Tax=Streptococcus ferus TaxID=1345 RepID=A0A2X3Y1C4_9STRE|nr:DUF1310 family protein [Streptococcus ferus]SQF41121.1 Lmo2807 protein [Streptococcus ferus]